jgi:glycosyltransferase involved in cell wall biosynthesis
MPEAKVVQKMHLGPAWPLYRRVFRRFVWPRIGGTPYNAETALLELSGFRHYLTHRPTLYHYLYGEENFRLLRFRRSPLVATFHHPPAQLAQWNVTGDYLQRLAAVVIQGESPRAHFEQFLPPERIHFVPHGIDTEYFMPGASAAVAPDAAFRCLTVGSWLRDHETLRATALAFQAASHRPKIVFDVIGNPAGKKHYTDCGNVNYLSNVPEAELLARYHNADLAVIPLTDCVANNAVLEALACGLPIVMTDVGSARNYVNDSCAALTPPADPQALYRTINALIDAPERRKQLAVAARRQAELLSWNRVAERMREVYAAAWQHCSS